MTAPLMLRLRAVVNVAHVIFRAEPQRGGAERYCDDLCRALLARGHRVSLLASRMGDVVAGAARVPVAAAGLTRAARYRAFCDALERHLHATRYDVVHAHLPVRMCDVYHAHAGIETTALNQGHLSRPTLRGQVTTLIGNRLNGKRRAVAHVESHLLSGPRPPFTLCLSRRERDEAARRFPSAAHRLLTMHPTPDDARFPVEGRRKRRRAVRRGLGLGDDAPLFLFIGQDFARKGLSTAIRALAAMADRRGILYVLGGDDVAPYSKLALRADVVGRVLFAGSVPNVADYLLAADALLLPSRHEPFGLVTVEAMLCGTPPIVSRIAGSSEVVDDGQTGFVVDDLHDPAPWAAAMTRLLDPATRQRLSDACLAARPRFTYAAHVDAIEALYRRVIGGGG